MSSKYATCTGTVEEPTNAILDTFVVIAVDIYGWKRRKNAGKMIK